MKRVPRAYEVVLAADYAGMREFGFDLVIDDASADSDEGSHPRELVRFGKILVAEACKSLASLGVLWGLGCGRGVLVVGDAFEPANSAVPWDKEGELVSTLGGARAHQVQGTDCTLGFFSWIDREVSLEAAAEKFKSAYAPKCGDHPYCGWGDQPDFERFPREGESALDWALRVATPAEWLEKYSRRLESFDFNLKAAASFPRLSAADTQDSVVPGGFYLQSVATISGEPGSGKTSLVHQLLYAANSSEENKTFLGRPIRGEFHAALFSAEEPSPHRFVAREAAFELEWKKPGNGLIRREVGPDTFERELADLQNLALRLGRRGILAIDSFQALNEEDETRAHLVTRFHTKIRQFAATSGWLVIVLLHTVKSSPRSAREFRAAVRGSSAHIGHIREGYCMISRGKPLTSFGCFKRNEAPADDWLKEYEEVLIIRDPDAPEIFIPAQASDDVGERATGGDIEAVAEAVAAIVAKGGRVFKSGSHGLFEQGHSRVRGLARSFIQDAIDALVVEGRLISTKDGLRPSVLFSDPVL